MSTSPARRDPREQRVPQWTIGDRLRKIRREMNMTQDAFAAMLEVGEPRYAAWESDRNEPRNLVSLAKRIELATGVPATWVLGLDETPSGPGGQPVGPVGLEPTTDGLHVRPGHGNVIDLRQRRAAAATPDEEYAA